MVASVTDPGLLGPSVAATRAASPRPASATESGAKVSTSLQREIAVTAKFGPDPVTGSPFQVISGDDVEAAETNDLQRLAEANLGLVSPQTAFQAQSIRSDEEISRETEASQSGEAAQQSLAAAQSSFSEIGGTGSAPGSERGSTVDVQV